MLNKQRKLIAEIAKKKYGGKKIKGTIEDLPVLQQIIDDKVFSEDQPNELEALGVVFGDVLAKEAGLHWEMITDMFGTEPALRLDDGLVIVAAYSMIAKRIEDGRDVDLAHLLAAQKMKMAEVRAAGNYKRES